MNPNQDFNLTCPLPIQNYPKVTLAHGGGGSLMHQLIEKIFKTTFSNPYLAQGHDSSVFTVGGKKLAMTTDSFVVHPIFFPGGDIGSLAVHGTVNDLAMSGARPLYLSAGFIIEEGLPMESLWRIVQSMQVAARQAGVEIITGDTKVVDKGKGDGVFINTAGIGVCEHNLEINPRMVREGDCLIVNGDIGRHGMAIMAVREGLQFESQIKSDSMSLASAVLALLEKGIDVHCLRDITRGGLATTLNEIAGVIGKTIAIDENLIPVQPDVHGACEMLGFDPLYVACEGRFSLFVPQKDADRALKILTEVSPDGVKPALIGNVTADTPGLVVMKSKIGVERIVDMLSGEQLPRIC